MLREQRRSYPDRTAVVCGAHRFTYPELDDRVNRLANALADLGVTEGERVLWLGQNCHRFFETLLATAKLGAICCPANWRLSGDEMAFVIDDSKPKVVIWQEEEIGERVRAAREKATHDAHWIQHDNGEYEALLADGSPIDPDVPVDPASSALMLYTAAFDGTPNGALLSQTAMLWQSLTWGATHDFTYETVYLASEPMFHVAGLMNLIGTFHRGGTNVFADASTPRRSAASSRPSAARRPTSSTRPSTRSSSSTRTGSTTSRASAHHRATPNGTRWSRSAQAHGTNNPAATAKPKPWACSRTTHSEVVHSQACKHASSTRRATRRRQAKPANSQPEARRRWTATSTVPT